MKKIISFSSPVLYTRTYDDDDTDHRTRIVLDTQKNGDDNRDEISSSSGSPSQCNVHTRSRQSRSCVIPPPRAHTCTLYCTDRRPSALQLESQYTFCGCTWFFLCSRQRMGIHAKTRHISFWSDRFEKCSILFVFLFRTIFRVTTARKRYIACPKRIRHGQSARFYNVVSTVVFS